MAMFTPAQKPRGAARMIRMVCLAVEPYHNVCLDVARSRSPLAARPRAPITLVLTVRKNA